jgi:hypothetical protein
MGWLDKLNPFRSESKEKKAQDEVIEPAAEGGPQCSVCGKAGADKRFASMFFHKKCLRKTRKQAKGMV